MILFGGHSRFYEEGEIVELHTGELVVVTKVRGAYCEARSLNWLEKLWHHVTTWGDRR